MCCCWVYETGLISIYICSAVVTYRHNLSTGSGSPCTLSGNHLPLWSGIPAATCRHCAFFFYFFIGWSLISNWTINWKNWCRNYLKNVKLCQGLAKNNEKWIITNLRRFHSEGKKLKSEKMMYNSGEDADEMLWQELWGGNGPVNTFCCNTLGFQMLSSTDIFEPIDIRLHCCGLAK